jgi:hypothetical protein
MQKRTMSPYYQRHRKWMHIHLYQRSPQTDNIVKHPTQVAVTALFYGSEETDLVITIQPHLLRTWTGSVLQR